MVYFLALLLGFPYLLYKVISTPGARGSLGARLGWIPSRDSEKPLMILHGVSVGEIKASRTLFAGLEKSFPGWDFVVTSTTPAGFEMARKVYPEIPVHYFPADLSFSVNRFLRRLRPQAIILMEVEIWPNFLSQARRNSVPVFLANGRISNRSFRRYRAFRRLLFHPFEKIQHYCVQTEEYQQRFRELGVPENRIDVTGSLKFDTALPSVSSEEVEKIRDSLGLSLNRPVFVAGSTHAGEEMLVLRAFEELRKKHEQLVLILVPRYPNRADEVSELVRKSGMVPQRKSMLPAGNSLGDSVLVVDTMGELEKSYAIASAVFVGGSLVPRGGQNMIEPAALGRPVFFGPLIENFAEMGGMLVEGGGADFVRDASDMEKKIDRVLSSPDFGEAMGQKGKALVERLRGATNRTVEILCAELRQKER